MSRMIKLGWTLQKSMDMPETYFDAIITALARAA
jgi:hypothetical protein